MEKSNASDNTKILKRLNNLEYICLIGPMLKSFSPLSKYDGYICIDGGAYLKSSLPSHTPILTIGDGDSYNQTHDINYPVKKDMSDYALSLEALPSSVKKIDLYGLRNGRRDHEFINIGETLRYLSEHPNLSTATMINEHDKEGLESWYALNKGTHLMNFKGTFSIISLHKQKLNISGDALYSCDNIEIEALSSQGLSNVAKGHFTIVCQKPILVMRSSGD